MKISVIMPSYLGDYEGCALDRDNKFIRAVNSFINNHYQNKELIIIGDACKKTASILKEKFQKHLDSGLIKFHNCWFKKKVFSGYLRTKGIKLASGQYIIYLDSDDMFGLEHIQNVVDQIKNTKYDWGYYNDFILTEKGLLPKNVELVKDSIGTSSIFHVNSSLLNWKRCNGYGHDFKFIQKLMAFSKNCGKVFGCSYIICHIPNLVDL